VVEDTVFHSALPCVVATLDSKRRIVGTANQRDIFSHAWQPSAIQTRDGGVFGQLCGVRHGWTVCGRTADQVGILLDWTWAAEQVPLHFVAPLARQEAKLIFGLDALGNDRKLQAMCERNDPRMIETDCCVPSSLDTNERSILILWIGNSCK
jgi:hypothetical protein